MDLDTAEQLHRFAVEALAEDVAGRVTPAELYRAYVAWYHSKPRKLWVLETPNQLGRWMTMRYTRRRGATGSVYRGIKLLPARVG
jgi:hypothetical protein